MNDRMQQLGQGMQGLGAARGMNPDRQVYFLPGTPPEMRQQYQRQLEQSMQQPQSRGMPQQGREVPSQISDLYGGQRQPSTQQRQPLTQEQLQQLQQFGTPLNQAPARFRKGGEAKKKAAAQGRMAKPAGRGRTTKPAVRGRMAKPTRGKK